MSLEAISTWAQLIAAIGVIGSLFYLGVQIRQNTRSMRAVVVDSLAQSFADLVRPMAQDIVVMRAFAAASSDWNKASDDDRARALPLFFATFKLFENAWFQQHQGTLRFGTMGGLGSVCSFVLSPARCESVVAEPAKGFRPRFPGLSRNERTY